ncbi:MAG: FG-GAP-like repeat-containing protein [Bacteroidales bacterium]|jgi:RHS repeat-associated protein|nr:FG-GAP-like repeat-containing protein [Bacteroidales bacterium]
MVRRWVALLFWVAVCLSQLVGQNSDTIDTTSRRSIIGRPAVTGAVIPDLPDLEITIGIASPDVVNPPIVFPPIVLPPIIEDSSLQPSTPLNPMSMSGSLSVGATGAATYTFPIEVPKGVRSTQPQISLVYNSQSGRGVAGLDFHLSGLSAITRCGRNIYYDGVQAGISLTAEDRLALDGVRLRTFDSRNIYWADGSLYETEEQPSFFTIQYVDKSSEPYFVITQKDGTKLYYGGTDNALVLHSNGTPLQYLLRSVVDAYGNTMTYTYKRVAGAVYIENIRYSGQNNQINILRASSITGATHFRQLSNNGDCLLKFHYQNRPVEIYGYQFGSKIKDTLLLNKIEIFIRDTLQYSYSLTYDFTTRYEPLLKQIDRATATGKLYRPVTFTWSGLNSGNHDFIDQTVSLGVTGYDEKNCNAFRIGDVNGDGLADRVWYEDGTVRVWLGKANNATGTQSWDVIYSENNIFGNYGEHPKNKDKIDYPFYLVDMNGDGYDDLVSVLLGGIYLLFSNGDGTFSQYNDTEPYSLAYTAKTKRKQNLPTGRLVFEDQVLFGDLNGDGLNDMVVSNREDKKVYVYLNKGLAAPNNTDNRILSSSFDFPHFFHDVDNSKNLTGFSLADVTGDGRLDIIENTQTCRTGDVPATDNSDGIFVEIRVYDGMSGEKTLFFINYIFEPMFSKMFLPNNAEQKLEHFYYADINGDGTADLIHKNKNGLYIHFSTGSFFNHTADIVVPHFLHTDGSYDQKKFPLTFTDMNGDGRVDVVMVGSRNISVAINEVTRFSFSHWGTSAGVDNVEHWVMPIGRDEYPDIVRWEKQSSILVKFSQVSDKKRITEVGQNVSHKWQIDYDYSRVTDDNNHKYPLFKVRNVPVARKISLSIDGKKHEETSYTFKDGVLHLLGKGFLGFSNIYKVNPLTSESIETSFYLDAGFCRLLPCQNITRVDIDVLNRETIKYSSLGGDNENRYRYINYPVLSSREIYYALTNHSEKYNYTYDYDGNIVREEKRSQLGNIAISGSSSASSGTSSGQNVSPYIITTRPIFDDFIVPVVTTASEAFTITDYNDYIKSAVGSVPCLPTKITTKVGYSGKTALNDTVELFYNDKGDITEKRDRTGSVFYKYNSRGLVTEEIENGLSKKYSYTSDSRFLQEERDTLGAVTYKYDNRGLLLQQKDSKGKTWQYEYDVYGRLTKETDPYGVQSQYQLNVCSLTDENVPPNSYMAQTTITMPGTRQITYIDKLGRTLGTRTQTRDGWVNMRTEYDDLSRVSRESLPYFDNGESAWKTFTYDKYSRIVQEKILDQEKNYSYSGLTTTVTNPGMGSKRVETKNSAGDVTKIEESAIDGSDKITTTYTYAHIGKPSSIQSAGDEVKMEYDIYGRQTALIDPDAGRVEYTYDDRDRQLSKKEANGIVTNYTYDYLDRIATQQGEANITYEYETTGGGKGQIRKVSMDNGTSVQYGYDDFGDLLWTENAIDTVNMRTSYTHDRYGRVSRKTFPNGFGVLYEYDNTYGDLVRLTNIDRSLIWKKGKENANGQILSSMLGVDAKDLVISESSGAVGRIIFNRYTYDELGRRISQNVSSWSAFNPVTLTHTHTYKQGTSQLNVHTCKISSFVTINQTTGIGETFTYDVHNRLRSVTSQKYGENIGDGGGINITLGVPKETLIDYAPNGNIIKKTGFLSYQYNAIRPHALAKAIIDDNSQIASTYYLSGYNISHNPFHRPATIVNKAGTLSMEFDYNPLYERIYSRYENTDSNKIREKYYSGDYEMMFENGVLKEQLCYIFTPEGRQAVSITDGFGNRKMHYLVTDYMGSINMVVEEESGGWEFYGYDAWGQRNAFFSTFRLEGFIETGDVYPVLSMAEVYRVRPLIERGYCGQEHLDEFHLINMNARLYDPITGRFLSPDPYVQSPLMSQNFNRYSYGLNNPLMYSDPNGEFVWAPILFAAIAGSIIGSMSGMEMAGNMGATSFWDWTKYIIGGGLIGGSAGFLGGIVGVGVAGAVGTSGFWAGAAIGASSGLASGFTAGFGNALLSGQNFGQALGQGALGGLIGAASGGLLGGISGGVDAVGAGKNFWHGARTVERTILVEHEKIPSVRQIGDKNCLPATIEAVDRSFGGNMSQGKVRELLKLEPDLDKPLPGLDTWVKYGEYSGHKVNPERPDVGSADKILSNMRNGIRVGISLTNSNTDVGHTVAMQRIVQKTITKHNGIAVQKILYYVMDPVYGSVVRMPSYRIFDASAIFYIGP